MARRSSDPREASSSFGDLERWSERRLLQELERRRQRRREGAIRDDAPGAARLRETRQRRSNLEGEGRRAGSQGLARYYRRLELPDGASWEQVRRAYERLMERYHPHRFLGDPARYRDAVRLARAMTEAYLVLRETLQQRAEGQERLAEPVPARDAGARRSGGTERGP